MQLPAGYTEVLSDLAQCVRELLARRIPTDQAADLALEITEGIRARFGGSMVYIPKGDASQRDQRDQAILREFDGRNHRDLAIRHNLSLKQVYAVIARTKKNGAADATTARDTQGQKSAARRCGFS